jgi:ABC-type polysaccharide/polyol phosphate transport system ATPase subunit
LTAIAPHTAEERSAPADASAPAVSVQALDKTFRLPHQRYSTLKERVLHPFASRAHDELHALHNVSFDVARGEFFGIVGRNGSGKSTLLKCLAGIYRADRGEIRLTGRISPFIELGVGFHPEMAARDNIILNGVMLGLTPKSARARVDSVIEFAELEDFVDLKLKNYSSGMHVRLAFSVMIQVDADVLLIDEILAVGDAAFQQKCFDVFFRLREEGKTIVLVTHDMAAVERFCHRAVLLERGEVAALGDPSTVADRYLDINFSGTSADDPNRLGGERGGDGAGRVVEAWMEDEDGVRQTAFLQGVRCKFCARVEFERTVENPEFSVAFVNAQRQNVFVAGSAHDRSESGHFAPGTSALFSVTFENSLSPGRYALSTLVTRRGGGNAVIDRHENVFTVVVTGARSAGGLVDLPSESTVVRGGHPRS